MANIQKKDATATKTGEIKVETREIHNPSELSGIDPRRMLGLVFEEGRDAMIVALSELVSIAKKIEIAIPDPLDGRVPMAALLSVQFAGSMVLTEIVGIMTIEVMAMVEAIAIKMKKDGIGSVLLPAYTGGKAVTYRGSLDVQRNGVMDLRPIPEINATHIRVANDTIFFVSDDGRELRKTYISWLAKKGWKDNSTVIETFGGQIAYLGRFNLNKGNIHITLKNGEAMEVPALSSTQTTAKKKPLNIGGSARSHITAVTRGLGGDVIAAFELSGKKRNIVLTPTPLAA